MLFHYRLDNLKLIVGIIYRKVGLIAHTKFLYILSQYSDAGAVERCRPYTVNICAHIFKTFFKLCRRLIRKGHHKYVPRLYSVLAENLRKTLSRIKVVNFACKKTLRKSDIIIGQLSYGIAVIRITEKEHICDTVTKHGGFTASCACYYKHCSVYAEHRLFLHIVCTAEILVQHLFFQC